MKICVIINKVVDCIVTLDFGAWLRGKLNAIETTEKSPILC